MLDEVIRELTARNKDEQMTSKGVLAWAKRVEVQQVQTAILNDIMELHQFDKIKSGKKVKGQPNKANNKQDRATTSMQVLQWVPHATTVSSIWEDVHWMWEDWPFQEGVLEKEGPFGA